MIPEDPTASTNCPTCGAPDDPAFNYCPFCGHNVRLACPACHTALQSGWTWCPTCGHRMGAQPGSIPTRMGGVEPVAPRGGASETFNQRGVELYESERYDEAIEQFQQALTLEPTNSLYHCNLAVALGEKGDNAAAFGEYQRALELNPGDLTAHLNLGYYYNEQEQTDKARQEWERVIDLAVDSPEADEARENLRNLGS